MTLRYGLELAANSWSWAAAGCVALAFIWHARNSPAGRPLLWLRGLAVLGLLLALLKPSLVYREFFLAKPKLAVLIDDSHSMQGATDGAVRKGFTTSRTVPGVLLSPGGTRLRQSLDWLAKNRKKMEARAQPVLFMMAGHARKISWDDLARPKSPDAAFNPSETLREVMEDPALTPAPSRAWLLSDGNAEAASDWDRVLAALKVPLDVLGVGPARRGRQLGFLEIKTPDFAFLHGRFSVQAGVEASALAGETMRVRLLREQGGAQKAWELVEEKAVKVLSDYEVITASFSAVAQTLGSERYRLSGLAAGAGAGGGLSHSREFRVEVIRQKYRIMYLSGRPSPEYAQLRDFLKSDPNHELVSFVILRNPENPATFADNELSLIPFPAEEIFVQSLSQFDLFILENFSYARFHLPPAYLDSLKRFVGAGGALLVIGGENAFGLGGYRASALEEMLPVTLGAAAPDFINGLFKAKPAAPSHPLVKLWDTAQASAAAWEALPPMDGYARFGAVKPGATVLAVHPSERTARGEPLPVIALREYGRGKVMLVSSDSTWRWKLGSGGALDWKIGSFYARFWSKAVEYLTGSLDLSKVKFAPLPDRIAPREPARVLLRVFDEGFKPAEKSLTEISVWWTPPDGRLREVLPQEIEPGIYAIELTGLAAGTHRLKASAKLRGRPWGEDQINFLWEPGLTGAPMDRRWLKNAADATGGTLADLSAADAAGLLEKLPPTRREAEVKRRYYPWAEPWWLWLTAALFIAEWGLRRWKGHA